MKEYVLLNDNEKEKKSYFYNVKDGQIYLFKVTKHLGKKSTGVLSNIAKLGGSGGLVGYFLYMRYRDQQALGPSLSLAFLIVLLGFFMGYILTIISLRFQMSRGIMTPEETSLARLEELFKKKEADIKNLKSMARLLLAIMIPSTLVFAFLGYPSFLLLFLVFLLWMIFFWLIGIHRPVYIRRIREQLDKGNFYIK